MELLQPTRVGITVYNNQEQENEINANIRDAFRMLSIARCSGSTSSSEISVSSTVGEQHKIVQVVGGVGAGVANPEMNTVCGSEFKLSDEDNGNYALQVEQADDSKKELVCKQGWGHSTATVLVVIMARTQDTGARAVQVLQQQGRMRHARRRS